VRQEKVANIPVRKVYRRGGNIVQHPQGSLYPEALRGGVHLVADDGLHQSVSVKRLAVGVPFQQSKTQDSFPRLRPQEFVGHHATQIVAQLRRARREMFQGDGVGGDESAEA
jgi:hypothetical protein